VTGLKAKGVKVTLALGGWNESGGNKYSVLVNDPLKRATFIQSTLAYLKKHNFDGLDLDWEYPVCWQGNCNAGPASDKAAFATFVKELRAALPKGAILSAAVSASKVIVDKGQFIFIFFIDVADSVGMQESACLLIWLC
jgi:chitinase